MPKPMLLSLRHRRSCQGPHVSVAGRPPCAEGSSSATPFGCSEGTLDPKVLVAPVVPMAMPSVHAMYHVPCTVDLP